MGGRRSARSTTCSLDLFRVGQKLAHAQRLVRAAAAADAADEAAWQASPAGRVTDAEDAITALRSTTDAQRELLGDLLAATGGGGLVDRPRIALTDALSGALLALTDLPGLIRAGTCGDRKCRRDPDRLQPRPQRPARARSTRSHRRLPPLGRARPLDARPRPALPIPRLPPTRAPRRRTRPPPPLSRRARPAPATSRATAPPTIGANTRRPAGEHELEADGTLTVTTPTGLVAVTTPPPY